jgi:hypothetical protein
MHRQNPASRRAGTWNLRQKRAPGKPCPPAAAVVGYRLSGVINLEMEGQGRLACSPRLSEPRVFFQVHSSAAEFGLR